MPSTHSNILLHIVFSTKNRVKLIHDEWRDELIKYFGGTIKDHKGHLLDAGGIEDHVHLLVRCATSVAIADTVRHIKSNSSRWINEHQKTKSQFEWQRGYGVFSVSQSVRQALSVYIRSQREHHQLHSFEQEYFQTLLLHEIEFDERFVFDLEVSG